MRYLTLLENTVCASTISQLAGEIGLRSDDLYSQLTGLSGYLSKKLNVKDILHLERDRFAFRKITGVFRVNDCLEIEVIPKFLNGCDDWRGEVLQLLSMSAKRRVLDAKSIVSVRSGRRGSLAEEITCLFIELYKKVESAPIRTYQAISFSSFAFEGDLDEESIFLPDSEGFLQKTSMFTIKNRYNAVIADAALCLLEMTTNYVDRNRLLGIASRLGGSSRVRDAGRGDVPPQYSRWQPLYALSTNILKGKTMTLGQDGASPYPSIVVRTQDAWEELMRRALSYSFGPSLQYHGRYEFAKREGKSVMLVPDFIVRANNSADCILDAKYKYLNSDSAGALTSDLYEGYAYSSTTGIKNVVLLFPSSDEGGHGAFNISQVTKRSDFCLYVAKVCPKAMIGGDFEAFKNDLRNFMANLPT